MKKDIYEMIAQNMANKQEYSFEYSIVPLIKEITEGLDLKKVLDSMECKVDADSEKSPFQQTLSNKPRYCEYLNKVIESCKDFDPNLFKKYIKYMQEYEGNIEEDFKENHAKLIEDLKRWH